MRSDARKRLAEANDTVFARELDETARLFTTVVGCKGCRAAGITTPDAHLAAAKAEALGELRVRLVVAERRIKELTPTYGEEERVRLSGKAEGVRLALSYVEEALRAARLREQGDQ